MKTDNELLKLNDNYTKLGEIYNLLEKIESIIDPQITRSYQAELKFENTLKYKYNVPYAIYISSDYDDL